MKHLIAHLFIVFIFTTCQNQPAKQQGHHALSQNSTKITNTSFAVKSQQYIIVLGIAQDAGYPQAGCTRSCCKNVWQHTEQKKMVVSLGIVDQSIQKKWLIEATPDFKEQLYLLNNYLPSASMLPSGILITHGHIGHYTGLMHLGREVIGAKNVLVYALPKMKTFLANNGPWSQLVKLKNIHIQSIYPDSSIQISPQIKVIPFQVPHRDEFTETVGYKIIGSKKSVLFIPDIDKWKKWNVDIKKMIQVVDVALIDGTFYKNGEIPGRDMSQIPHPFVEESMLFLKDLPASDKKKIHFIHFNHTNPLVQIQSREKQEVLKKGFNIARERLIIALDE